MEKYKNKYRIPSARASWWNYAWSGAYFITICTNDRIHFFGEISEQKMTLSPLGILADAFWHEIPHHAKEVELGAFVAMPNHVHGILILSGHEHADNLPADPAQRFQNQGKNTISSIVGGYKAAVTKHARRLGFEFGWQSRFHDHIIHDDAEYQRINDYIETNPANWDKDKFF